MKLSEMIQNTADYLNGTISETRSPVDFKREFSCWAFRHSNNLGEEDWYNPNYLDFRELLREGGIPTMSGDLFKPPPSEGVNAEYYRENAQPVRFMYLNLLAEMLEDAGE